MVRRLIDGCVAARLAGDRVAVLLVAASGIASQAAEIVSVLDAAPIPDTTTMSCLGIVAADREISDCDHHSDQRDQFASH